MWSAIASFGALVVKYLLFGFLKSYLDKRAGANEENLRGEIEVAKKREKQQEALVDGAAAIADADDFADRVRDSGF